MGRNENKIDRLVGKLNRINNKFNSSKRKIADRLMSRIVLREVKSPSDSFIGSLKSLKECNVPGWYKMYLYNPDNGDIIYRVKDAILDTTIDGSSVAIFNFNDNFERIDIRVLEDLLRCCGYYMSYTNIVEARQ